MRIELPLPAPRASAYHFYAFPLAIAQTMRQGRAWAASNFIQVEFDPRGECAPVPFSFTMCDYAVSPLLATMSMSLGWFERGGVAVSLIEALEGGWYVYTFVDQFHLPGRDAFREHELIHDTLVHGYDASRDSFLTYGYDQHLLLASIWTERSSFESAYASALEKSPSHARTVLYRPNHDASDKLSIPLIVRTLDEYLNSYNTSEHFAPAFPSREFIYGVQTYELLAENLARDFSDGEFTNLRNLQVLWEHKRLMADRAELLSRAAPRVASLVPALREVEREAKALRNLALQARHSGGGVDRNALVRDVSRLQRNEARTLTKLLARLGD